MSPWTAQRMGAIVGAMLAGAWVIWTRTRATPCPGAVTLEFHPPLADPGNYAFSLDLGGAKPCTFNVSLPQSSTSSAASGCRMARELRTQVRDGQVSISELTFAAAPEHFHLRVTLDHEKIYDTELTPKYAPYETTRAENKRFCGDRARVVPGCVAGSAECQPFPVTCSAPQACGRARSCCLTPEWGRDFGPKAASECASRNDCFAHFGHLVCQADADCPADLRCLLTKASQSFSPPLRTCERP